MKTSNFQFLMFDAYLRQRKDAACDRLYPVSRMKKQLLTPKTTVEEVLQGSTQIGRIFAAYHTACVGCYLMRFCTLEEMAAFYGIDLPSFLDVLQQSSLPVAELKKGE